MASSTRKQEVQQALSWKLKMVKGAIGTLYPREKDLPDAVRIELQFIQHHLGNVEKSLRRALRNIK